MSRGTGVRVARGALYVLSCVIAAIVVVGLIVCGYYTAMHTTNVNMIVKEAFARRAQAVLLPSSDGSDRIMLERLFAPRVISTDEMLNSSYYKEFEIINYYEDTDVEFHIVWPWDDEVTLSVTEVVRDITGDRVAGTDGEVQTGDATPLPWRSGVYEVTLKKDVVTESWRISALKLVEQIILEEEEEDATESVGEATVSPRPSESAGLDTMTEMDEVPPQTAEPEEFAEPEAGDG